MRKYPETPIYKKAEEILETIIAITDIFPEDNQALLSLKDQLLSDAMIIQVKLASACSVKLYDVKMENATLIRKAARDLMVAYHSPEMFDFEEVEYHQLVRTQIEKIPLAFIRT